MKTSCQDSSNSKKNRDQLLKIGRRLFLAGLIATTAGCQNMIRRGQSPDDPLNISKYENGTFKPSARPIKDVCVFFGLESQKVYGVGLATELGGTGSEPIESGQREHLQRELQLTKSREAVKELLASKDSELVIIEGRIPPGSRAGDSFDLEIVTMNESDGTSLENGIVLQSRLRKMSHLGNRVRKGNITATAGGPVIVNSLVTNTDESGDAVHGVIPGGGKATEDRQISLRIQGDEMNQKTAVRIAQAINRRFRYRTGVGKDGVAEPKSDRIIELQIPDVYLNNLGRYGLVLNQLFFAETSRQQQERFAELEVQIGQPGQSGLVAMQLEAIGDKALPVLKATLSHSDLEVRFHAAEALAYLGDADGIEHLVAALKADKKYRWDALAALSALDGRESANVLSEIFNEPEVELRYGAFKAIRQQNEEDPIVTGDFLASGFFLHEVDSTADPAIHFSTHSRAEIVVFGSEAALDDSFLYVESGLTIKGGADDTISVTAYSADFTKQQRVCSNQVADLIRTLAELGYGFGSQLKILRQASLNDKLNAELAINKAPRRSRAPRASQREFTGYKDIEPETGVEKFMNMIKL